MDEVKEEKEFTVAFSYLEVYNEQIRDLLANVGPLAVREDGQKGVVVQGLTLHQPKSAEHILEALDSGNRNRTQHPTDMNATSSRSHAVFQIYLRQQDKSASLHTNACVAKMSLIDLAGSERASHTNAKGARLREGANINRSLLALGNVINALADPKSKKAHIPYRDSKLTRILKDSLGGNCRTVMIANVSPSSKSYDDTHNTLKYANRAKEIKSTLKSNVVSLDSHIGQYAVICEKQRQEIQQLKQKLKQYEGKNLPLGAAGRNAFPKQAEFQRISDTLHSIFLSRVEIRQQQLELERQLKENELRQRYCEEDQQQVQLFCAKVKTEKATCKFERKIASLRAQQQYIQKRLKDTKVQFIENDGCLHRLENEIKLLKSSNHISEVLEKELHSHRLELQVSDLKQHIRQMVELTALQDQENKRVRKMVNILLPAYSRQYSSLDEAGLNMKLDQMESAELEHLVLRERGVVWADQERAELTLKAEGNGDEPKATQGTEALGCCSELAPVLTFSHLHYHQSSPCSSEAHLKRSPLCHGISSPTGKAENQTDAKQDITSKASIRRNLSASMASQRIGTFPHLPVSEEGVVPLQRTPEPIQRALQAACTDANATFEVTDTENQANVTICLGRNISSPIQNPNSAPLSGPSHPLLPPKANMSKRPPILSLQEIRRGKPSYMEMTSSAQGKRKLNHVIKDDSSQGISAAKRMKKEPLGTNKPLRVQRERGSEENRPQRVVRSISEGNLNLLAPQKPRSIFYKTTQKFKQVAKRM